MTQEPSEAIDLLSPPHLGQSSPREMALTLFRFLKSAATPEALYQRGIPILEQDFRGFRLLPVSEMHANDTVLISELAAWRSSAHRIFPTQSAITLEGTSRWLRTSVLDNEERILFLVSDDFGARHGHLGIWIRDGERFELDNVLRNPSSQTRGLFSAATRALGIWSNAFLGLENISLRVLESNDHAVNFYMNLGFNVVSKTPMKWVQDEGVKLLAEMDSGECVSDDAWLVMERETESWNTTDDVILTAGPLIGPIELALTADAARSGWNRHHSDFIGEFSQSFADYVDAEFAIPTDSCTSALHLALWALGIGPGDEVIVPEITWVATAAAVRYVGASPVFADVDPHTWCIDADSVEQLITKRTRAIIPVHLYGYVADLGPLQSLCQKYGLRLVQDAAPAIGSLYYAESIAKLGDVSCFSFQGAKLLVSGEGGVLTTNSSDLFDRASKIADSGRKAGTFWIETLGKKMKMSNLTASLALAQLQSAELQIARKRMIRDWYEEELKDLEGVTFQREMSETRAICWMTSIRIDRPDFDRQSFREDLARRGIDTRPVFSPISRYPIWEHKVKAQPIASLIGDTSINLPSGVRLSRNAISRVAEAVREILDG